METVKNNLEKVAHIQTGCCKNFSSVVENSIEDCYVS